MGQMNWILVVIIDRKLACKYFSDFAMGNLRKNEQSEEIDKNHGMASSPSYDADSHYRKPKPKGQKVIFIMRWDEKG